MNRKYFLAALVAIIVAVATIFYFTSYEYRVQKNISASCVYMAYAFFPAVSPLRWFVQSEGRCGV